MRNSNIHASPWDEFIMHDVITNFISQLHGGMGLAIHYLAIHTEVWLNIFVWVWECILMKLAFALGDWLMKFGLRNVGSDYPTLWRHE